MEKTPLCDELLKGVAIVIDDEVDDPSSDIAHLIEDVEKRKIPCLKYSKIPDDSLIESFSDAPFIILDWKFDVAGGVSGSQYQLEDNIEFIRNIRKKYFVPIFIFTNKNLDDLKEDLCSHNAADFVGDSMIFLKNKSELIEGKLFFEIENWLKSTPSAYVIKKWAMEYKKATNSMFLDLYSKHSSWPSVFWNGYISDSINPADELNEMLLKNLQGRFSSIEFDAKVLNHDTQTCCSGEDLLNVWEGAYFIPNQSLDKNTVKPGDIFFVDGKYFINIKPECDCVGRSDSELELYLVEGEVCDSTNLKNFLKCKGVGNATEKPKPCQSNSHNISGYACFGVCGGKHLNFNFKSFTIKYWSDIRDSRDGRLTQPFIGYIQQKFSAHIKRIGLPPLPNELGQYILGKDKSDK